MLYTVAERWDDVLALYDRAIDANKDKARRVRLLREAAQLAKDVANQPEKAIRYYQQLLPLVPDDAQVNTGLERLLERHERWADLIALWEGRLEGQSKKDRERAARASRRAGSTTSSDPQNALAAVKPLLAEAEDDAESCALLERIIEAPKATTGVRAAALDLLRSHYDATSRPREVIRVLEKIIALDPDEHARAARGSRYAARRARRPARRDGSLRGAARDRARIDRRPRRSCASSPSKAAITSATPTASRPRRAAPRSIRRARSSCSPRPHARASSA